MKTEIITYLNKLASEFINDYDISLVNLDMRKIIEKMGGTIEETDSCSVEKDAIIQKIDNNHFKICLDKNHSKYQQNYDIAYEIACLMLFMGYKTNLQTWEETPVGIDFTYNKQNQVNPAAYLAKAILLPRNELDFLINLYSDTYTIDFVSIRNITNIDETVIRERAIALGIIG